MENDPLSLIVILGGLLIYFVMFLLVGHRGQGLDRKIISLISKAAATPSYRSSLPELYKEISRARRLQKPFAVMVIRQNANILVQKEITVKEEFIYKYGANPNQFNLIEFLMCGPIFRDSFRQIDIMTYDGANNRFIIFLPESTKMQAIQAINRPMKLIGQRAANQLTVGIAEFPEDGLTIEDLVKHAVTSATQNSMGHQIRSEMDV